jgi:hypothetical protein
MWGASASHGIPIWSLVESRRSGKRAGPAASEEGRAGPGIARVPRRGWPVHAADVGLPGWRDVRNRASNMYRAFLTTWACKAGATVASASKRASKVLKLTANVAIRNSDWSIPYSISNLPYLNAQLFWNIQLRSCKGNAHRSLRTGIRVFRLPCLLYAGTLFFMHAHLLKIVMAWLFRKLIPEDPQADSRTSESTPWLGGGGPAPASRSRRGEAPR